MTREPVADLDTLDLDALLSAAKSNLQKATTDGSPESNHANDDSLSAVKASISKLPQLADVFPSADAADAAASKSSSKEMEFRQISDPVLVKAAKKAAREATAGAQWFDMPRSEVTDTVRRDWQILQMRNVLDPKRHYKKETAPIPKFFQTGTVIEGNTEFFSARIARKDRKKTIADEILNNDKARDYFKRKFDEIQVKKHSGRTKHYKKIKEMRSKR
jgi:hypothetical protein